MNIKDLTAQDLEGTVIAFHGNKVVATKGKNVSVAKCSPDDTYNAQIGVEIALGRLFEPKDEAFSPKELEEYWSVGDLCLSPSLPPTILKHTFSLISYSDRLKCKLGICYKTYAAAERHMKEDIIKIENLLKLDGE